MKERRNSLQLSKPLASVAQKWEIGLSEESSVVPSVAGLVPDNIPVICGIGPVARDLYTPQEAVNRISLIQRTLLTAEFLAQDINPDRDYSAGTATCSCFSPRDGCNSPFSCY